MRFKILDSVTKQPVEISGEFVRILSYRKSVLHNCYEVHDGVPRLNTDFWLVSDWGTGMTISAHCDTRAAAVESAKARCKDNAARLPELFYQFAQINENRFFRLNITIDANKAKQVNALFTLLEVLKKR